MKIRILVVLGFAAVQSVLANGGGYSRGGVERTGDVAGFEPQATENIRILDEKLTILLGPEEADVEVRYLMRNETAKRVKVRFGFPVEETFSSEMGARQTKQSSLQYCKNYEISAAGRELRAVWQAEKGGAEDKRFEGLAGWLVSEMTFAAGEEKPVLIRFQSVYPEEHSFVSDTGSTSAAIFKYRLSTAACWAGTIGTGRIVVKPNGTDPRELRVLKPVNRFQKEGDQWVWNFEDLEPTLADDLEIEVRPAVYTQWEEGNKRYIERGERWVMAHSNFAVAASSTLAPEEKHSYEVGNLKNYWRDEVWSEGAPGPGVGEWLELKPVAPKPLHSISILPGYVSHGKEELFHANARPKKIRVELNGEHRFHADVPDSPKEVVIPVTGYRKPVKTVRLTFEEVWEGNRDEDLCITGIQLHVLLDKEPKLSPVR